MPDSNEQWVNDTDTEELDPSLLPQPVGWRLVVQPVAPKTKTRGGIILADTSREAEEYNNCRGKVLAVGSMCWRGTSEDRTDSRTWHGGPWAKVGDWVTYGKYAGQKLVVNGVKLIIINDDELTSVLTDPDVLKAYV
jgi:co-chaperonin GroES (HSP10)